MGNTPGNHAYSSSSSYVNGVGQTHTQESHCSWYNPFCGGASANTSSFASNMAPGFVGAISAVVLLSGFLLVVFWVAFNSRRQSRRSLSNLSFLEDASIDGRKEPRMHHRFVLDSDVNLVVIENENYKNRVIPA